MGERVHFSSLADVGRGRLVDIVYALSDFSAAGVVVVVGGAEVRPEVLGACRWLADYQRARVAQLATTTLERAKREGTRSGRPVGRPRAGVPSLIEESVLRVLDGRCTIKTGAIAARCSERTMRRHVDNAKRGVTTAAGPPAATTPRQE